jgi:hypothetical protein
MVQSKIIQVDVAFLTYDPKRCSDSPLVRQDNSCVIGGEELKKHREMKRREKVNMGDDAYHHYKWYNSMLNYELKSNQENSKLKVIHWHIESGNTEAFMMNGKLYKSVSIIIGELMEHWYCANIGIGACRSYGSRYRKVQSEEEKISKKLAIFTIDEDEATLVATGDSFTKCTTDICANNCIECKKFRSPFSKNNKDIKCACYPTKEDFKSITESDLEDLDSDDDIAQVQLPTFDRKKYFRGNMLLNAINEE